MNLKITYLAFFMSMLIGSQFYAQTVITQWDFNTITPGDITTATPSTGSGDVSLIGGITTPTNGFTGTGSSDPSATNNAFQTTAYPLQSLDNQTAGVQFETSTAGFENIELTFDIRLSNTSSRWIQIQYTTDGALWQNLGTPTRIAGMGDDNAGDQWHNNQQFDFSAITAANDNPDFGIRIVTSFSSAAFTLYNTSTSYLADEAYESARNPSTGANSNYSGGTMRYDMITFSGDPIVASATEFYSNGTGVLNDLATWGTNTDGTGTNPTNFTDDGQTFYIYNGNSTIDANWLVSGLGSSVILGDGTDPITFTVPQGFSFEGLIDVSNNGTLELNNATIPTLGTLNDGSLVHYATDAVDVSYANYYDLILNNIDPVFTANGTINIRGDISLLGTVNMPDARDAFEYDVIFNGDGDQVITSNGNVLRSYNLEFIKTTGNVTVTVGSILSADSQTTFNMATGTLYEDNAALHYAGNSVNITGDENAYNFTGTLILADEEAGIVKGSGDGNNFNIREGANTNIVAQLNNIIVRSVNENGEFRFRDGSSNIFTIKGDFIVEPQVLGRVRFYDNLVDAKGDFIIQSGFLGTFDEIQTLRFSGSVDQALSPDFTDFSVANLEVNIPANELNIMNNVLVTSSLDLTSGIVNTDAAAALQLAAGVTVSNYNQTSFVNGPVQAEVNSDANTSLTFPIGKANDLRAVTLQVDHTNIESAWYQAEMFNAAPAVLPVSTDLEDVSTVRYYEIEQLVAVDVDGYSLTLNYDTDDAVAVPADLRIAFADATEWITLGGFGSSATTGDITTTIAFSELGTFALGTVASGTVLTPEIIVTPASLTFFNQELGSPSDEQAFTVQGSNLESDIEITAPANFEISLTSGAGFTNQLTLTESGGMVTATTVYIHLNSAAEGNFSGDVEFTSDNATTVTRLVEGETIEVIAPPAQDLIYYWHFNNLDAPDANVTEIDADYSLVPGFLPKMVYTGSSNADMDEFSPGSLINAQMGELAGKAARVRNRSLNRTLDFNFNTLGCADLVMEFAVHRSGSGMLINHVFYSLDGGLTYSQNDMPETSFTITEDYELITVDFTQVIGANDNPNFMVRIEWEGNTDQENGNNRYDNITLKGDATNVSVNEVSLTNTSILVYPNPANNVLNIETGVKTDFIQIVDMTGKIVLTTQPENFKTSINVESLKAGVYMVCLGNTVDYKQVRFVKY